MLRSYLTIAVRNLIKNKIFSFINIFGLAIGLASSLLIMAFVSFELSFDNFHEHGNSLYRCVRQGDTNEHGKILYKSPYTHGAQGAAMMNEAPEIENFVRFLNYSGIISVGSKAFREENIVYADNSLFEMFTFPIISGDTKSPLKNTHCVVLTKSIAKKYFGDENPIGKQIEYGNWRTYTVTGVINDLPANCSFNFNIIFSFSTLNTFRGNVDNDWNDHSYFTYVKLRPGANRKNVEKKLRNLFKKYRDETDTNLLLLQPIQEMHLLSEDFTSITMEYGSITKVRFLIIIAVLIIIIAWVNSVNLCMSGIASRAKESGVRKTSGASRKKLIFQFLIESIFVNVIAIVLGVSLIQLFTPVYLKFTGVIFQFKQFISSPFWWYYFLFIITGIIISGLYPGYILSTFNPILTLKGKLEFKFTKGLNFNKGLTIFQLICSLILIFCSLVIYKQISFMRNQPLGMNIEQILVIHAPEIIPGEYNSSYDCPYRKNYRSSLDVFRNEIQKIPGVKKFSASSVIPGRRFGYGYGGIIRKRNQSIEDQYLRVGHVDKNFIDLYNLEVLKGIDIPRNCGIDKYVYLTEQSCKHMGFTSYEEALKNGVVNYKNEYVVVAGIIKDFHNESIKRIPESMVIFLSEHQQYYYSIKLQNTNFRETISHIKNHFNNLFPGNPFNFFFLNEYFNQQYKTDIRFGYLFGALTILAVFIACMGILGLTLRSIKNRTKEIGIRKINGASVNNLFFTLTKGVSTLVIVSIVFAVPISYISMSNWLENYPYRIKLGISYGLIPVFIILLITFLTISYQIIQIARRNPADALRYE